MEIATMIKRYSLVHWGKFFLKEMTKTRYLFFAFLCLLILNILLSSCNDEGYSLGDVYGDYGVVDKSGSPYTVKTDRGTVLFPAVSGIPSAYLKDKDRLIVYYTILDDADTNRYYDYYVKIVNVYKILTKDILPYTVSISDSLGNDPVEMRKIWIANDFLTFDFDFAGGRPGEQHMVNLVRYPQKSEDGRVVLEFRHNAFEDTYNCRYRGLASFPVAQIREEATDSVRLQIRYQDFESEKYYDLTWRVHQPETKRETAYLLRQDAYRTGNFR